MAIKHRIIPPLTPQDILRFWSKVRIRGLDECWPWMAGKWSGYGRFRLGSRLDNSDRMFPAHRVAWAIANGPIPHGLCVCHKYDHPFCQNPSHLFAGTHAENMHDRDRKGRHNPACGDRNSSRMHPERQARGERIANAKFAEQDVRDIRRRAAEGESQRALAREYGVCSDTVWRIVHRKTWAHVI